MGINSGRRLTLGLTLTLAAGVLAAPPAGARAAELGDRVAVIVTFEVPGRSGAARPSAIRAVRADVLDTLPARAFGVRARYQHIPAVALNVDEHALEALARHPLVDAVGAVQKRRASMDRANRLTGARLVQLRGIRGRGVNVAVVDTGIDPHHPGLRDDLVEARCWGGGLFGCTPTDTDGHGTHVAGIITGPRGVAPDATFRSLKVFSGNDAFDDDILAALDHVIALNAARPRTVELVNMSLGGNVHYSSSARCDADNPGFPEAFARLNAQGTAVFVATGNERRLNGIAAPGCVTGAVGVGSVDDVATTTEGGCPPSAQDRVSCFSNTTPVQGAGELVDLLAPGCDITSTWPGGSSEVLCGTSMASPYAAGVAALTHDFARRVGVRLGAARVERVLEATGVPVRDHRLSAGPAYPRVSPPRMVRHLAPQPDGRIRREGAELRGNNVYGVPRRQTVAVRERAGRVARFVVSLQNDGPRPQRLRVRGGSSSRHYRVAYFRGGRNVTQTVVAGNLRTPRLRPGQAARLMAVVTVGRAAPRGSVLRRAVVARSTRLATYSDAVGFTVRRR